MQRHFQISLRHWSGRPRSVSVSGRFAFVVTALTLFLTVSGARASNLVVLPNAVSYEYFGFNFAANVETSATIGALTYTGGPGCGGTCISATQLGQDPSISLNVNEIVFDNTAGGGADAWLGYYVEYVNSTPGTYAVNMHAPESLSISDGTSGAFAYLALGRADGAPGTFNDFASYTLQEADCVNNGCNYIPVAGVTPAPFTADHSVSMVANTPYFVLLEVQITPSPTGVQLQASIDPQFSATATGGYFAYSAGVTDAGATPEPGSLGLILLGLTLLGGLQFGRRFRFSKARRRPSRNGSSRSSR